MTEARKKITLPYLFKKVADKEPITWLTCYDYPTAYLQEQAGIEMILVGDSLGMTMLGLAGWGAGAAGSAGRAAEAAPLPRLRARRRDPRRAPPRPVARR